MSNFLKDQYNNFVKNNLIVYDEKQIQLLKDINDIWKNNKKINFFSSIKKYKGVYLYGSTGIGKTFIFNLFVQNIKKAEKYHFSHFMINLHAAINNSKDKNTYIEQYIKDISKKNKIIFIDELHIFNIVDALLIKKIFAVFEKYKIFILVTSNFCPSELYKNGLQRSDFLPFISFIEKNYKIIHLDNLQDYRRLMLNQAKTYFTPINKKTSFEFNKLFEKLVDKSEIHIQKVKTRSRIIRFEKCTSNVAYCKFSELCLTNLGHEDYKNIANVFSLLFISNIPCFTASNSDQCRRFINLIDMLYEQNCSVVMLAEYPINQLCKINSLNKEFQRTASRLYEMTIVNSEEE